MKKNRKIYCTLTVIIAVLAVLCTYGFVQLNNYRNSVIANYRRAFTELVGYVSDIDVTLSKAMVTTDKNQLAGLSEQLWMYSAFAKENLGMLPVSSTELDNTSNFLSQVGDYTYSLSKKQARGGEITDDERTQLDSLAEYSGVLTNQLLSMQEGVMNGSVPLGDTDGILNRSVAVFSSDMHEIEEKFSGYTSLIYDGPFSEHNETEGSELIKKAAEINKEQAAQAAKDFFGADKVKSISLSGECSGSIPCYDFTVETDKTDSSVYIKVAKNGGYIIMLLDNRAVTDVTLEPEQCSEAAKTFLVDKGFTKMKQTGYIVETNSVVFSFAYMQNEFIMYPDLIKVKIALDNGEVTGFEANGFLSNHVESRQLPQLMLSKEDAAAKMNPKFNVQQINKALIPLETGREVYCYEVRGLYNGKTFLIYINTETGAEEKILMLVESETGALTA